ncbi:MAG: PhnA domain-containing protein [Flavobacteriales bacterium]|nr:PhnA domain-containing protein [Flavobacteriales bacterium]
MSKEIIARSGSKCELCGSENDLQFYVVPPKSAGNAAHAIHACGTCFEQLNDAEKVDANHWRCLNDSMWSTVPAVQVVAYRMLNQLKSEGWPQDLLDMMYMEEDTATWAKEGMADESDEAIIHRDANGIVLSYGDSVVLIKDLNVKGTSMVAKRGEAVRNITLVHDNAEQIEGRVNGQMIVILTQYVKKTN